MCLIGLELLVVRELDVDGSAAELGHAAAEVRHHRHCRYLLRHFEECLVFALKHEYISDPPEGQAELYDLGFCCLIRDVPYVDDSRRFADILFEFHLFSSGVLVVIVGVVRSGGRHDGDATLRKKLVGASLYANVDGEV